MQIFPDFLTHSVIVFNKWIWTGEQRKNLWKETFQEKFATDYQHPNISFYFIDSYYSLKILRDNDDGTKSKKYLHTNIQESEVRYLADCLKQIASEPKHHKDDEERAAEEQFYIEA